MIYMAVYLSRTIIISYCIITIKYWLLAISKENELVNSPLILQESNIYGIEVITVLLYG